jgi:hypothetical protein
MEVKFEHLAEATRSLVAIEGQKAVTIKITNKLHELSPGSTLLKPLENPQDVGNNVQKIFRIENGWINGYTAKQRSKFLALAPAILAILPEALRHLIERYDSIRCWALNAVQESLNEAVLADMDALELVQLQVQNPELYATPKYH